MATSRDNLQIYTRPSSRILVSSLALLQWLHCRRLILTSVIRNFDDHHSCNPSPWNPGQSWSIFFSQFTRACRVNGNYFFRLYDFSAARMPKDAWFETRPEPILEQPKFRGIAEPFFWKLLLDFPLKMCVECNDFTVRKNRETLSTITMELPFDRARKT